MKQSKLVQRNVDVARPVDPLEVLVHREEGRPVQPVVRPAAV